MLDRILRISGSREVNGPHINLVSIFIWFQYLVLDCLIAFSAEMPFLQVPALEVDGKMLAQSHSIARYLARKFNLAGKDDWEEALADMYVDNINDLLTVRFTYMKRYLHEYF